MTVPITSTGSSKGLRLAIFLIPDDGWKYLSSGVYTKPIEEIENLDSTVWW